MKNNILIYGALASGAALLLYLFISSRNENPYVYKGYDFSRCLVPNEATRLVEIKKMQDKIAAGKVSIQMLPVAEGGNLINKALANGCADIPF
jgi:hypothetical protein